MRVAFVSPDATPDPETDRARRVVGTAEQLATRGHDVFVCSVHWWDAPAHEHDHAGVTYVATGLVSGDRSFAARLPATLARLRPDVVHGVHDHHGVVLAARVGAALARARLVVDWYDYDDRVRDAWPRRALDRRLRGLAVRAPARVLVPSELVGLRVQQAGADGDRVRVVPNAVEFDAIRATDPVDAGDIVYARRLDADANLESLLLALAELRTSDWSATVIGDGPARAAYERQAADLRIDDRVAFTGTLSREQRVARYRGAHAFVHTARRTPFATELLWALASGCTGVVEYHAESSAHELVEARERGFLATGGDELVDCLRGAAGLPRQDIDEAFAAFDEERVTDRYLDAY